jgi:hypothetical protein
MGQNGTRDGSIVVSFHAVNPIWEGMMAGVQTAFNEALSQQVSKELGVTGKEAEVVEALTQLAINAATGGNGDDSQDWIISGVAGALPHLSPYIPQMGTSWITQTYLNIKQAMYKGFDRRYRYEPR